MRASLRLPRRSTAALAAAGLAVIAGLTARPARAQLHWDVGAQVGVAKRFTSGADANVPSPSFGPTAEIQGHVALVPMVRVGAYFAQDVSPISGGPVRTFWEGGLHAKVTPPLLPAPWRAYAFVGFGYAYAYRVSYSPAGAGGPFVPGASGGLLDIPVGLGLGVKAFGPRRPWVLFTELGARPGVGAYGPMYAGKPLAPGGPQPAIMIPSFLGKDSFALTWTLGLSLEQ